MPGLASYSGIAPLSSFKLPDIPQAPGSGNVAFNFFRDLRDAAVGLPMGVVSLIKDPIKTVEMMAETTWHDWSPLFHGDLDTWGSNFMEHPLFPILDVAALFSGGATLAGRGAAGLSKTGAVSRTSLIGRLGDYTMHRDLGGRSPYTGEFLSEGVRRGFAYKDPTGAGRVAPQRFYTKGNPLARARQEWMHKRALDMDDTINKIWGVRSISQGAKFERAHAGKLYRNQGALHAFTTGMIKAARDLEDPAKMPGLKRQIFKRNYQQASHFAEWWDPRRAIPEGYMALKKNPDLNKYGQGVDLDVGLREFGKEITVKNTGGGKVLGAKAASRAVSNKPFRARYKKESNKAYAKAHKQWLDSRPKIKIVPVQDMYKHLEDAARGQSALRKVFRDTTTIWKVIMLGYAPRFLTNNAVGNMILYLSTQGGHNATRGLVDAFRQVKNEKQLAKDIAKTGELGPSSIMQKHFGDQQIGIHTEIVMQKAESGKMARAMIQQATKWSLFPIVHSVSDVFMRKASVMAKLRGIPEIRTRAAQLQKQGYKQNAAFEKAAMDFLDNPKNAPTRAAISEEVNIAMGDYANLSNAERAMRDFVPFYTWDRHIIRASKKLALDHPARTAVGALLGREGAEMTEEALGGMLPKFLKGSLPMKALGFDFSHPGREAIIGTQGLNPFATVPDIMDAVRAGVGAGGGRLGGTLGSQINPFAASAIEAFSGTSMLTGAPVPQGPGGLPGNILSNITQDLPQFKLLQNLAQGTPKPSDPNKPFLYEKSLAELWFAFLGVPYKQVDVNRARELAKTEIKGGML